MIERQQHFLKTKFHNFFKSSSVSFKTNFLVFGAMILGCLIANFLVLILSRPVTLLIAIISLLAILNDYWQKNSNQSLTYFINTVVITSVSTSLVQSWHESLELPYGSLLAGVSIILIFLVINQHFQMLTIHYPVQITYIFATTLVFTSIDWLLASSQSSAFKSILLIVGLLAFFSITVLRQMISTRQLIISFLLMISVGFLFGGLVEPFLAQHFLAEDNASQMILVQNFSI
ncbi:hypothetical protein [Pediococcus ethanolidurans]|uniref:hypothetical protein n=1 Tax=Pediococcus ethanolidurans TaxID=319653 RepID=UPI001C1ED1AE|nr:hypothetical protein [Pediococcus ethanolidurans]MBU7554098.1 hypothetical protein [Pediococcus ethanolidurans]MCT4397730.1 hypothetical protein [Pediococcus ethanolidurans]MCV3314631.1 hypothetical protein [Pediococcus ethanolidurans]MCV3321204.1 hypothetical protein [Pediococcus ethanolidurans]MCV3323680.1 hypothetical protein [Pediococcus ethanolidurans]